MQKKRTIQMQGLRTIWHISLETQGTLDNFPSLLCTEQIHGDLWPREGTTDFKIRSRCESWVDFLLMIMNYLISLGLNSLFEKKGVMLPISQVFGSHNEPVDIINNFWYIENYQYIVAIIIILSLLFLLTLWCQKRRLFFSKKKHSKGNN